MTIPTDLAQDGTQTSLRVALLTRLNNGLVDWVVVLFAGWSLTAHATVLLGGSLIHLMVASALVVPAIAVLFVVAGRMSPSVVEGESVTHPGFSFGLTDAFRAAFLFAAIAITCTIGLTQDLTQDVTHNFVLAWHLICAYFLAALFFLRTSHQPLMSYRDDKGVIAVWVLAILAAGLALAAHCPNADDAIYLNVAAATADAPRLPLLARDTLHAAVNIPILLPVYRVETVNLLSGALSYLSGIEPIVFNHLWLPAAAAFCCVFALARLFRRLLPNGWLLGVIAVLLFLVAYGETPKSYGNFSFIRLHQGKAIFVTALVPLIVFYGIAVGRQPSLRNVLRLIASQIAAVGLTSTALWAAPALGLAIVAGAAAGRPWRIASRALGWGCVGCLYPLGLALLLRAETAELMSKVQLPAMPDDLFDRTFQRQFGAGPLASLSIFWLLSAWLFVTTDTARRLAVVAPMLFFLVLFNPYIVPLITTYVIPPQVYWRAFWVLPLPVICGVALVAPWGAGHANRWLRWTVVLFPFVFAAGVFESGFQNLQHQIAGLTIAMKGLLAGLVVAGLVLAALATWGLGHKAAVRGWSGIMLVAILLVVLPARSILSAENGVRIILPPTIKVDPSYDIAEFLAGRLSTSDAVLCPEPATVWLAGLRRGPRSLCARGTYARYLQAHLDRDEVMRRLKLKSFVSGTIKLQSLDVFRTDVAFYDLQAVCLHQRMPQLREARAVLMDAGFDHVKTISPIDIWIRAKEPDLPPIAMTH